MKRVNVKQVDVFASEMFKGNPAGVAQNADSLQLDEMQQIALEMNLSQTAFLLKPLKSAEARVRFFTTETEVNLCGHSTLAAAHVLAEDLKIFLHEPTTKISLETNSGLIPVEINIEHGKVNKITMTMPKPSFESCSIEPELLAKCLGLTTNDLKLSKSPLEIVKTGLRILILPVKSIQIMDEINLHHKILEEICEQLHISGTYCFCLEAKNPFAVAHARFFAPSLGFKEEPATGIAGGALGAYLIRNKLIRGNSPLSIVIEQGVELNRPGEIHIETTFSENEISEIKVGGKTITTLEGEILLNKRGEKYDR